MFLPAAGAGGSGSAGRGCLYPAAGPAAPGPERLERTLGTVASLSPECLLLWGVDLALIEKIPPPPNISLRFA